MRILILGASGLIGSNIFEYLSLSSNHEIWGTYRRRSVLDEFSDKLLGHLIPFNYRSIDDIDELLDLISVDVVINALGITKHVDASSLEMNLIRANSLLPHELAFSCKRRDIKLIHISTDCVFSGRKGFYTEADAPDSDDLYGKSKAMGEVIYDSNLTIRTSTIGHELNSNYGLLNWFLNQNNECQGFKKAYFSGLPTVELARVIAEYVIPSPHLNGLYHLAGASISKFDLLKLIATEYGKRIQIIPEDQFSIDRSLNGEKFQDATGYKAPDWPTLIKMMHQSHQGSRYV